jgi:hypothetical protein
MAWPSYHGLEIEQYLLPDHGEYVYRFSQWNVLKRCGCGGLQHYAQCELLPRDSAVSPDSKVAIQFNQQHRTLDPVAH